jgi:hypothetical protein
MHSGGSIKEPPYGSIYIQAPMEEAIVIFYNRYGHNPNRVSCTCCGEDYVISSHESLAQLTGHERHCRTLVTPRDPETGRYQNDDPIIVAHLYLEKGEEPPTGYKVDQGFLSSSPYQTLEEYMLRGDVALLVSQDIKPSERRGTVPDEGYVWVGD